ncbi:MAG: helix-turn-helix domain-containing protein [Emergencia sp.]|nr:helix-turn-helix domain-containing protein [Emergencia sp.]
MDTRTLDYEKIGAFIAQRRKEKHLTQLQLAELLGVTDRAVSKWERAKSFPDVSILHSLCDALSISVNELFAGELSTQRCFCEPEVGERMLKGIRSYLKKQRKRTVTAWMTVGVLMIIILFSVIFYWQSKQPVNFAEGDFVIREIQGVLSDGTVYTLATESGTEEIAQKRIKTLLQNIEGIERLDARQLYQEYYIEIKGIGIFYQNGYYDEKSACYYSYEQIWFTYLENLVRNYAEEENYIYRGKKEFDFGDRSVTLNTEVVEKPQELIIDEFCDMIKGNEAGNKSAHVESIKILSIENLSDDILFSHSEVEAIQKEITYLSLYDYRVYEVVSEFKYTESLKALGPQIKEGVRQQLFLIGDRGDGYEICYKTFPFFP